MNLTDLPSRRIELDGCYNLRDIGGYPTRSGQVTRWKTVFRADSLHRLPRESQEHLLAYPVRTIVDLRRSNELEEAPNVFAGSSHVNYLNISLLDDENEARGLGNLAELYRKMLQKCQGQFGELFSMLATDADFPILVHCTAGKDRTGLVIALLLGLAEVPDELIAEDYSLSAQYLTPLFAELRQRVSKVGMDMAGFEKLLGSDREIMLETLGFLNENFGGAGKYLETLGLNQSKLNHLKERLVA